MDNTEYDWKVGAIHDFKNTNMSYQEIADKYSRARITVVKLIQRTPGCERPEGVVNKGGRTKFDDQPVVSKLHKTIGTRLNMYRTVEVKENLTEFAGRLMVNRYTLRKMELGLHDFTLSELNRLSQVLTTTTGDLLTPRKEYYAG